MLREEHLKEWRRAGVWDEIIELNVESIGGREAIARLGWKGGSISDGWWSGKKYGQFKPDVKPVLNGKEVKYLSPKAQSPQAIFLDMPDPEYWNKVRADKSIPVVITEGVKKAGAGLSAGFATIALTGVWNGQVDKIKLVAGLSPFVAYRTVILAFDADIVRKPEVKAALDNFAEICTASDGKVKIWNWDEADGKGLDDLIQNKGAQWQEFIEVTEWKPPQKKKSKSKVFYTKLRDYLQEHYSELQLNTLDNTFYFRNEPISFVTLRSDLSEALEYDYSKEVMMELLHDCASKNPMNPVKNYLNGLLDAQYGVIDKLCDVMGQKEPLQRAYIRKTLIGAVARIYEPGCKMDTMLVLYSAKQGMKKSTFCEIMGGEWFSNLNGQDTPKDELLQLHSSWILEYGELDYITSRRASSQLKNMLATRSDKFRAPYARETEEHKRQFIFIGTTNKLNFLSDESGNRRYWVCTITDRINSDWVAANRDALWCEARDAYFNGEPWWFEEEAPIEEANKEHTEDSSYYDSLVDILPQLKKSEHRLNSIAMKIGIDDNDIDKVKHKLTAELHKLGFASKRIRVNGHQVSVWYFKS